MMAVKGEGDDVLAYTKIWLENVNRGGLFPLSDEAFRFFIEIELSVCTYLPQHMLKTVIKKHLRMYIAKFWKMRMCCFIGYSFARHR